MLEDDGVIRRQSDSEGITYTLTEAGEELRPIVDALGHWAKRWVTRDYEPYELDPGVLMWSLRRHVLAEQFPARRTVLHFRFDDAPRLRRYWYRGAPGAAGCRGVLLRSGTSGRVDRDVAAPNHRRILMGAAKLADMLRQKRVQLEGDRDLVRRFEQLFEFSDHHTFAGIPEPEGTRPLTR